MYRGKFLGTIICAVLVLSTCAVIAADRSNAAAYRLVINNPDEVIPPPAPENMEPTPSPAPAPAPYEEGYPERGLQPRPYHAEGPNGEAFPKHGYIEQNGFDGDGCGSCGIDSSGCDPCGCNPCCCQRWTVTADAIILGRIGTKGQSLLQSFPIDSNSPVGTDVLNSNDFEQGFAAGPRISVIRHGDRCYDLELMYFQIDGWHSARTVAPTPGTTLGFSVPGVPTIPITVPVRFDYTSRLYNAEINLRWNPCERVTMMAGFRWLQLRENLDGTALPSIPLAPVTFTNSHTENDLYGFQLGTDAKLYECCRFSIDGVLKAGIYGNHADQTTVLEAASGHASTNHVSFIGELGLNGKYQITDRLSATAGYHVMWLEGVALAPAQFQQSNFGTGTFGVDANGGAFYHGATAGLEYSF